MNIEIKKSIKPVNYSFAVNFMEERLEQILKENQKELIWLLEHNKVYTAGTGFIDNDVIDKSIKIIKTNRGGKITCHSPGQLICYFVIDLRKKKDVRRFINLIEKKIIDTLNFFEIKSFADRKDIGIWFKKSNHEKKIAAIGIKVKKWVAYHGFAININNNLEHFNKIIPCGISNKGVTNLKEIVDQDYSKLKDKLIENFILNLNI